MFGPDILSGHTAPGPGAGVLPELHQVPHEGVALDRSQATATANVSTTQATTDPSVEAGVAPPYNLMVPRSRCPSCEQLIGALDNIPVLSYLVLGGKCRHCKTPISIRYPLVEILTALLCTVAVFRFGLTWAGAGAVLLSCALIALAFIDLDRMLLPDNITLPFLWLGLALNTGPVFASLHDAVIGAITGYGILWLVYHAFRLLTGKEGMGYGDFKLTGMLGAWLGWQALPGIILLSSLVGAIVGVALILLAGRGRDKPIPFGPFLAAAGWIYLIWGPAIEYAYTHALGLS